MGAAILIGNKYYLPLYPIRVFMKRFHLRSISFIMTAVYLLITLSPLASISSRSKPFLQVLAKECSGDCRLCGCSAERSASHSCCCWQKRLAADKALHHDEDLKSCPTATALPVAKAARGCCSKPSQHADHENEASLSAQEEKSSGKDTHAVSISTCPCGSGKDLTFSGGERAQHIPCRFLPGIPLQAVTQFTCLQPERLASRDGDPPDPPPKVILS